jgi:cytidine deaminase
MFLAAGASRRSAELGRQVGAAIVTPRGSVISLGTNEVPRAGGGPYLESDSDDSREFHRPKETNRTHIERITSQITDVVKRRVESVLEGADLETETQRDLEERLLKELPEAVMAEGRVKDLTEFGRATHAEMAALLDASRRGVPVAGATLMTYTFPCHNCARHIVEAGIARVVYIEPYLKSLALDLHADAIALQGAEPQSTSKSPVEFEPFTGAAPRRYLEMFDAAWRESRGYLKRKDAEGRPADFDASMPTADPVIGDLEQAMLRPKVLVYRRGERRAIELLQENLETNGFTIKEQL